MRRGSPAASSTRHSRPHTPGHRVPAFERCENGLGCGHAVETEDIIDSLQVGFLTTPVAADRADLDLWCICLAHSRSLRAFPGDLRKALKIEYAGTRGRLTKPERGTQLPPSEGKTS